MLNQSEPNLILTAHATKLNRPEPHWTEPQTCLAGRNHAFSCKLHAPPRPVTWESSWVTWCSLRL